MLFSEQLFKVVFRYFNILVPSERIYFSRLIAHRLTDISAKDVKPCADFDKKFHAYAVPYWKQFRQYPHKNAFKVFWAEEKEPDPRYIPNDLWVWKVVPHFNRVLEYKGLANKSLQELLVQGIPYPETIVKRDFGVYYDGDFSPITREEICERVRAENKIIVKQSMDSYGGAGVVFEEMGDWSNEKILAYFDELDVDFVVQKLVRQHETLRQINPSSINTVRVLTFFYQGECHVLNAVLRIGGSGSRTDNITGGGFACGIHEDGRLFDRAVSREAGWQTHHPNGMAFKDIVVPNFRHVIDKVKNAAAHIPYFKILGWDIAIDEQGEPVVIEFNIQPEQNQLTFGPTFGDMTDEVLHEVFQKKPPIRSPITVSVKADDQKPESERKHIRKNR